MTTIYNNFKELLFSGSIDLANDTTKIALVSDSVAYTPDEDGEVFVNDVLDGAVAAEFSDASYSRQAVSMAISLDLVDDEAVADAINETFTGLNGDTIQGVLLYKEVTDDTDSPLIAYITSPDFPLPANGGDVTIEWASEGILNLG